MPRPKRTKIAPSVPAPRVKKAVKPNTALERASEISKSPFNDLYDVSDECESRGRSTRHIKIRNGRGEDSVVISSQSHISSSNTRNSEQLQPSDGDPKRQKRETVALEAEQSQAVPGDTGFSSSSPDVEVGRRETRTTPVENSAFVGRGLKGKPHQSHLYRKAVTAQSRNAELSIGEVDGLFGTRKRATSNMAVGNISRRSRESSRSRSGRKVQRNTHDSDSDDEDDFNPEDESTPLNLSKARNMASSSAGSSSNSRKRKLSAVQVPRSSLVLPSDAEEVEEEVVSATDALRDVSPGEDEESRSPERVPSSVQLRSDSPEIMSETMAPPHDSSSYTSSPEPSLPPTRRAPSRGTWTMRGRTPASTTQDSPVSSPPSLTHSPNRTSARVVAPTTKPRSRSRIKAPPLTSYSTAQLQTLLPQRRRRPTRDLFDIGSSEEEIDISGLNSDDDELSHLAARSRSRRRATVLSGTPAPLRKPQSAKSTTSTQTGTKRTYGSRGQATSDKENEEIDPDDSLAPLPDDGLIPSSESSQHMEERLGRELKRAARKFAEVDQWEMEFEDVTASSSSPRDAR